MLPPVKANPPWAELLLEGELCLDLANREKHSEDASIHRELPLAVARPKGKADLEKIVAFCSRHRLPIHGWGAGTSRGGQPLGPGLVVDFRAHFQKILGFDEASGLLRVECGALYSEVQKYLRPLGRTFPPDPSYHQCTVGGMVANNAAGIHSVKYGGTIEHVAAIEFLTMDGEWHNTARPDALGDRVETFLRENQAVIEADYPRVEKNSAGYSLNRALDSQRRLDLPKLLTGSEGTLALFSELTLATVPLPAATALGILYFSSLEAACQAAMDLRIYEIAACELVDKVLLDLHAAATIGTGANAPSKGLAGESISSPKHAKKIGHNPYLDLFYECGAEAVLVVEIEGATELEAFGRLEHAFGGIRQAIAGRFASSPAETALMWDLRRHTSPILNRLEDGKISIKPLWAVEDVSLPPENFLPYLAEQKKLFARHGLTCSFFGHAASCNLHIDPIALDPRVARQNLETAALFDRVAAESYALVVQFGGSISGEHGDGLTRTPFLHLQYPKAHRLFPELKALFDPEGLLNPGKIAGERNV